MNSPEKPRIEDSEITRYVLSKIDKYEDLNANTAAESEKKFDEILLANIPGDLDLLPIYEPQLKGHYVKDIYLFEQDGKRFLVKEMSFSGSTFWSEIELDRKMQKETDSFYLVDLYFHEYLPHTVFIKRKLKDADGSEKPEYLIVQDIGEGTQFKSLYIKHERLPEVSDSLRGQIQDVINRTVNMLKEIGLTIELDFMIDTKDSRLVIFDTGSLYYINSEIKYMLALQHRLNTLADAYDLTVPEFPDRGRYEE